MARWLLALVALLALSGATARKSPAPAPAPAPAHKQHEPQIEEVTAKQLERVLEDKDFVAVYWCKCVRERSLARRGWRAASTAGAAAAVSKRLRRRPSKWVILELMIFGRSEGTPAPVRYFEARPGLCNRAADTIKLDPAATAAPRPSARPKMVPSLVFHRSTAAAAAPRSGRLRSRLAVTVCC